MNNKKNYKKGYRREIIEILIMYGAIPYSSLALLTPHPRLYQRKIKEMVEDKMIEYRKTKNGVQYITLSISGLQNKNIKEIINQYPTEQRKKISVTKNLWTIRGREEREKLKANTNLMMYSAKIENTPNKKFPKEDYLYPNETIFYDSAELKSLISYKDKVITENNQPKVINSRVMGLLYSPGGIYTVYNIGSALIEWKRFGEIRMQSHVLSTLQRVCYEHIDRNMTKETIVIAKHNKLFYRICTEEVKAENKRKRILMNIDYAYDHMYAVTQNYEGVTQLKIMKTQGWKYKILNSTLSMEEMEDSKNVTITCDGYDKETDTYKLIFLIPDLMKLKPFVARAMLENCKKKFQIFCFSHHKDFIATYAGKYANIYLLDIEELYEKLFANEQ